jgi:type VI secretion system protein
MALEQSLLERLRDPGADRPRTIQENTSRLVDSVIANLRRLLNSRNGIAPIREDYGIPDLSDMVHSFPEANARMRAAIKAAVEKFEPRLRKVSVRPASAGDDMFSLRLEITAELVTPSQKAPVWFETRIDANGEVVIKS